VGGKPEAAVVTAPARNSLPERSIVLGDNPSEGDFVTVVRKIYKTIILPVVLYGCETWSLTLREEHRLRVFENRVLRRIFGPKRDEVTGGWRKMHNDDLHSLYSSPSIIRMTKLRKVR
jgi:hypothetical protein